MMMMEMMMKTTVRLVPDGSDNQPLTGKILIYVLYINLLGYYESQHCGHGSWGQLDCLDHAHAYWGDLQKICR